MFLYLSFAVDLPTSSTQRYIKKVSDTFYVCDMGKYGPASEQLTFCMTKLHEGNMMFWSSLTQKRLKSLLSHVVLPPLSHSVNDTTGFAALKPILLHQTLRTNAWIAYATDETNPEDINPCAQPDPERSAYWKEKERHLIMCFAVLTFEDSCQISSHMGIQRLFGFMADRAETFVKDHKSFTRQELENAMKPHGNISVLLHAFAGAVTLSQYPHKKIMVNFPASVMEKILERAFGKSLGCKIERCDTSKDIKIKTSDSESKECVYDGSGFDYDCLFGIGGSDPIGIPLVELASKLKVA